MEMSKPQTQFERWFPAGSRRRKALYTAGVVVAALIVIVLIFDKIIMPSVTKHGEEFTLNDFTSQRMIEAEVELEELGLSAEVASKEYSPGKEAGVIINQFPTGGTKVKSGRVIKFVISLGQKMVPIPDVAGKSVRQATLDLEGSGLELGEIAWAFSDTLPERVVVFSYPAANTEIPAGSKVNLMVNRGRSTDFTFVPKVIGLTLSEAISRLQDKSLKVGSIARQTDNNYLPETVLSQSEDEGTEVEVGTAIDLVISTTK